MTVTPTDILNNEVWATLAPSPIHGIGVFAIRDIPKGTIINSGQDNHYLWGIKEVDFKDILEPIRNMILDRTLFYDEDKVLYFRHPNSLVRLQCFMNHSDNPNSNGERTIRVVSCGEEITEDFNMARVELHKFTKERMSFLMGFEK